MINLSLVDLRIINGYVLGVHFIEGSVFYKISYFATLLSFSGILISYNFNFEYVCQEGVPPSEI